MRPRKLLPTIVLGVGVAALTAAGGAFAAPRSLPDGRAYELVSPGDAGGTDVESLAGTDIPVQTNADISDVSTALLTGPGTVLFSTGTQLRGFDTTGEEDFFLAKRTPAGWQTAYVGPPSLLLGEEPGVRYVGSSSDFSTLFFERLGLGLDPADTDPRDINSNRDFYRRETDGSFTWLSRGSQQPPNTAVPEWDGASEDGSHVVFSWARQLEPGATGFSVWERTGNTTRLVSVLPDESATSGRFKGMSRDASIIAFTATEPTSGTNQLYIRKNGMTTVEVSASRRSTPDTRKAARFEGMSADGARVFFSTTEQLTDDDTDTDRDLYEYDVSADALTRISTGSGGAGNGSACSPSPTLFQSAACDVNTVAVAPDGSRVYFLSPEQLDGTSGAADAPNLYVHAAGQTRFVATLDAADLQALDPSGNQIGLDAVDPRLRPVALTADGSRLAFESHAALTTYDNTDPTNGSVRHSEVYLYDDDTGRISCASCRPNGTQPTGDAVLKSRPLNNAPVYQRFARRNFTADGGSLFFESSDAVVTGDSNARTDVYEYDVDANKVDLISPGDGEFDAHYYDNSPDGTDVYFSTRDTLVPEDQNGPTLKLYDARVGGGFSSPLPKPGCTADECHGTPSGAPVDPVPSSDTFIGPIGPVAQSARVTFAVAPISSRQRARFAKAGRLTVTVTVSGPGTVTVRASSRLARHVSTVASARRRASAAGRLKVVLKLSRAARARLAHGHRLRLRLEVSMTGVRGKRVAYLDLQRVRHG